MLCPADTNEKILKASLSGFFGGDVRTGRTVAVYPLGTLGSARSLLCGEKLRENDTQSFSLCFQIRTALPLAKSVRINNRQLQNKKPAYWLVFCFGGDDRI